MTYAMKHQIKERKDLHKGNQFVQINVVGFRQGARKINLETVIVSGVAGRTPKNICLRCDLQFQYPAQPDTEKLEIDLRQIFFGGRPATPDTSIPQLYNQAIFGKRIRKCLTLPHALTDKFVWVFTSKHKFKSICWIFPVKTQMQMNLFDFTCQNTKFNSIFRIFPVKKQIWFEKIR